MRGIEIKHIKLVRSIIEIGNLTRAAKNLHISQPALSQQLLELEAYIGRPLFQRTKKRMIPTEAGENFMVQGEKVLAEMRQLESFVDRFSMGESGKLRISIDTAMCLVWLPVVMKQFRELYPNVEIHIVSANDSLMDLRNHNIDLAVVAHFDDCEDIQSSLLYDDELLAITPKNHNMMNKDFVTVQDCQNMDLIYHMDLEKSALYNNWFKPNNIQLKSFNHVAQPAAIIELVASGFGVGILVRWTADEAIRAGRIRARSIGAEGFSINWRAIYLKSQAQPYMDAFINLIREEADSRRYAALI